MKRYIAIILTSIALYGCETRTYEDLLEEQIIVGEVTYTQHARAVFDANCISCHSAGGTASFRPLTNYAEVKDAVQNTNLLERIQKQNGEPGLMPQTGRMPMDKIDIILQWNADGLPE